MLHFGCWASSGYHSDRLFARLRCSVVFLHCSFGFGIFLMEDHNFVKSEVDYVSGI